MKTFLLSLVAAAALVLSGTAQAEPTDITVRVISRDAKFIGSSMGGVRITISDADTGKVLAQGVTQGDTGDTQRLMAQSRERGQVLSTEGAAKFDASIDIDEPRRLRVTAFGPLDRPHAANTVSATQWIVPGKDLTGGDGWLLEMPGFVVRVLEVPAYTILKDGEASVPVRVHVSMMCGCPIEPGGFWDADGYEVTALLKKDGQTVGEQRLSYAGKTSEFSGTLTVAEEGAYEAIVYAFDAETGNTGVEHARFVVVPE